MAAPPPAFLAACIDFGDSLRWRANKVVFAYKMGEEADIGSRSAKQQPGGKAMAEGLLTVDAARSLVESVDAFLFDCDGVIWKGDELIQGVPETLDLLRKMGKKLVFVTNNSRKSRRQYSKKFKALGLEVTVEEIFTSSFAAAMFLKLNNFSPEKKVYVVGEDGILDELKLAGFECFGGPEDGKKSIMLEANFYFDHDKSVGAVIVGLDQYFNYYKMQ